MQLAPASEEGATKLSDKINPPGVALVTSLIVIPIAIIMAGAGLWHPVSFVSWRVRFLQH